MTDAHITIHHPSFRRLIIDTAPLETLGEGFAWLEGPVWFGDAGTLLFSDIPNDRILRFTASNRVIDIFRAPAGYPNGASRDVQGRLIHCHHGTRSVTRTEYDGAVTTLADRYAGKPLNSPNDVTVARDGAIWFTDPIYGLLTDYQGNRGTPELPPGLYRLDPSSAELRRMSDAFIGPNGLCFSPDQRTLYVSETGDMFDPSSDRHIARFDVLDCGTRLSAPTMFAAVRPGYADGFSCDEHGNLWTSAADGVHCIDPGGATLGVIHTPSLVANLCFGGARRNRLFICAGHTLHAIAVNTRGATCD